MVTTHAGVADEVLDEVRAAALGCTQCKLAATRTQVVFGVGNPRAPMVLVGQSPGQEEDRIGEPFVGRAGVLLNDCLAEVGLKREHVWITNAVKCRPCVDQPGGRTRDRDPEPDEIDACRTWIEAELALLRPKVIVAIGKPSAQMLLGRSVAITRERGRWFTEHRFQPAHIMPVLHTAYILRKHGPEHDELRQQLVDDLAAARDRARELLHQPPPVAALPEPEPEAQQGSLFD